MPVLTENARRNPIAMKKTQKKMRFLFQQLCYLVLSTLDLRRNWCTTRTLTIPSEILHKQTKEQKNVQKMNPSRRSGTRRKTLVKATQLSVSNEASGHGVHSSIGTVWPTAALSEGTCPCKNFWFQKVRSPAWSGLIIWTFVERPRGSTVGLRRNPSIDGTSDDQGGQQWD